MKFKTPILISLLLASCAGHMPMAPKTEMDTKRIPSSSVSEENLATSFEQLLNKEDPEKEFLNYLSRIKSIFARTEAYLVDFDKEVDEAVEKGNAIDFETSKSYKKLLVMREMRNRMQDKITYFYLKLTDVAYDKSQSMSQRKMAKRILKSFKTSLDSSSPIDKITFDDLKIHIAQALWARKGYTKSVNTADMPAENFKSEAQKLEVLRANREILRNLGRHEITKDDEINQNVENESEKVQLVQKDEGREPQSEKKYYPSTGSNGNVMGLIFPKGTWALTYDDGPNPTHTANIIKNLDELNIKATFFWLAQNVVSMQPTVDLVKSKGHVLANHSWSHQQLPKLSDEGLKKEINMSTAVEEKAYGQKVEFFRCPYGAGNSVLRIRQRIADLGMIHVFWNVDTLDWQDKDPDSIVERAKKQMIANGKGVVLFHDIHPQSVVASKKLVEWSKTFDGSANAIRWVTLPQIVKEMNGE